MEARGVFGAEFLGVLVGEVCIAGARQSFADFGEEGGGFVVGVGSSFGDQFRRFREKWLGVGRDVGSRLTALAFRFFE
jgi:hypothetical protein